MPNSKSTLEAPTITITQAGETLAATTTATDLPTTPVWQYSLPQATSPTCSTLTTWLGGQSVNHITFGQYYCFRVTDKLNNTGYTSLKTVKSSPVLAVNQSATAARATALNLAPDLGINNQFGKSVALDGDYLAVGSPHDHGHSGSNTGAVYIFKRIGTTWALEQEISDKSSGFTALESGDQFGYRVALGW